VLLTVDFYSWASIEIFNQVFIGVTESGQPVFCDGHFVISSALSDTAETVFYGVVQVNDNLRGGDV